MGFHSPLLSRLGTQDPRHLRLCLLRRCRSDSDRDPFSQTYPRFKVQNYNGSVPGFLFPRGFPCPRVSSDPGSESPDWNFHPPRNLGHSLLAAKTDPDPKYHPQAPVQRGPRPLRRPPESIRSSLHYPDDFPLHLGGPLSVSIDGPSFRSSLGPSRPTLQRVSGPQRRRGASGRDGTEVGVRGRWSGSKKGRDSGTLEETVTETVVAGTTRRVLPCGIPFRTPFPKPVVSPVRTRTTLLR